MHEKPKNRDWVKNAAIIFLAVLLVLTFFSNTIMNRSLPEVATQEVTSGSIVARVRGTGTVTANSNTQVKMEKTRVIRSVLVKVGQQVEAGDVLFTLGEGSSEEIDAAEDTVRQLQASFDRTAVSVPEYNYGTDKRKIGILADRLKEAEANLNAARQAALAASPNSNTVEDIQKELKQAIEARDAAKIEYDKERKATEGQTVNSIAYYAGKGTLDNLESELNSTHNDMTVQELDNFHVAIIRILVGDNELDGDLLNDSLYQDRTKISTEIDRVNTMIDGDSYYITFMNEGTVLQYQPFSYNAVPVYYGETPTKASTETEYYTFNGWLPAISIVTGEKTYEAQFTPHAIVIDSGNHDGEGDDPSTPTPIVINIDVDVNTGDKQPTASVTADVQGADDATINTNSFEAPASSTPDEGTEEIPLASFAPVTASDETAENDSEEIEPKSPVTGEKSRTELLAWLEDLEQALKLYDEAEGYKYYKEQILNQLKAKYDAAVSEAEKWTSALDSFLEYGSAESAVYKTMQQAYVSAKDNYDTAVETLEQKYAENERTIAGYNIDLATTWQQLEKARQKLADLTGGEEAQVLARVSGTVQSIDCSPGDTKKKDDVLATIEAPDMGYSLSFSVTNEQANRLRPGDTATVSNFYWGTEIVATLNSIKIDQKNPQTNKLLTFDLSGNVTAGSELTLSVGQKSANYDIIIPSSSIRTDANGSFVLKVESKNSPLGNRYSAKRVPVEVLASDDTNSAVSADLGFGDYVITTSSTPIKSGELVRLATS